MTVQQSYEPSSREESAEERHPEGAIRLLDGTILTCYPKPEEEEQPSNESQPEEVLQQSEEVVADELPLETMERHFGMGRRRIAPKPEAKEVLRQSFIDNAFYLLAHRERILQDSRMFLTPIGVQNGSPYTKSLGLDAPTIGVYLEWWSSCLGSMVLSKSGRMSLIYELTGSPHSKVTSGRQLYEDGETEPIHLYSFVHYWEPLIEINKRYNEAKKIYEAYTLQELLDILHEEDGGEKDFTSNVRERFLRHHIAELKAYIEHLYEEFSIRKERWTYAELRLHDDEVLQIYADYKALEQRVTSEIEELRRQKQSLKRQLRSDQLTPRSYEEALKSVKAQTCQLKGQLSSFEYNVKWRFRDEGMISIQDICTYVQNKDKEVSDTTNNY